MRRIMDILSVCGLLGIAAYGVFRLPYLFPTNKLILSESFDVGFNNRVSVLAAIATIGLFYVRNRFWRQASLEPLDNLFCPPARAGKRCYPSMPWSVLLFFAGIYVAVPILLYLCLPSLEVWCEPISYLPRLELFWRHHLHLYSEIDWAYGPAIFYLPAMLIGSSRDMGISPDLAYLISYLIASLVGLIALFHVVNCFRIKVFYRILLFCLIALCGFSENLGINYTLLRFAVPYAAILIMHHVAERLAGKYPAIFGSSMSEQDTRWKDSEESGGSRAVLASTHPRKKKKSPIRESQVSAPKRVSPSKSREILKMSSICFACALAVMSISLEFGIAYVIAQSGYAAYRGYFSNRTWFWTILATVATPLVVLAIFPGCLQVLQGFSRGGNNFPVLPGPHIVLYLLSLFWLVPLLLGVCKARSDRANTPLLLAWALMAMVLISGALGRCDFGHVFFYGLGVFLLTIAALARFRPSFLPIYAVVFVACFGILGHLTTIIYASMGGQMESVFRTLAGNPTSNQPRTSPLIADLKLDEFSRVAAPFGLDRDTRRWLVKTQRFLPQHHPDYVNVLSPEDLSNKIKSLSKADIILAPEWVASLARMSDNDFLKARREQLPAYDKMHARTIGVLLLWPISYQSKQLPFQPQLVEARYVAAHFRPIRKAHGWVLMKPAAESKQAAPLPELPAAPSEKTQPAKANNQATNAR